MPKILWRKLLWVSIARFMKIFYIMIVNNAEFAYIHTHSYPILQLTQLRTLADQYSQLQKTLLRMLQTTWGSNHSIPDHLETSNGCLLCHGMSLWLTLANKLILKYVQIELEKQDAGKMINQFSGDFFVSSSWPTSVDEVKGLWCSSTVWLLSART